MGCRREAAGRRHETTSPPAAAACPVCNTAFTRVRRQRYCTPACRQAAWRARGTASELEASRPAEPRRGPWQVGVYACPECEAHYLAQQWCEDCNRPCLRVGYGGSCPSCNEPLPLTNCSPPTTMTSPAPAERISLQVSQGRFRAPSRQRHATSRKTPRQLRDASRHEIIRQDHEPSADLGVVPREVGQAGDRWDLPDRGVEPVMVVLVEPGRERFSAG